MTKRPASCADCEPIQHAIDHWSEIPEQVQDVFEADLDNVHELATHEGVQCLREEIESRRRIGRSTSLPEGFDELDGYEDKVATALVSDPRLIQVARLFRRSDTLSSRSWVRFDDIPAVPGLVFTEEMGDALAASMKRRYAKEGRGRRITVERYLRDEMHYAFVFVSWYLDA